MIEVSQLDWEDIQVGAKLPAITLLVTYEKVVMVPMATWDLFPGHSNPYYAVAQRQKTIYLNTIVLQGLCDRVLTDWTGHTTFIARRKMTMLDSVYADDTLTSQGRVEKVYRDDGGNCKIDVSIALSTQTGIACMADITAILRGRHPSTRFDSPN
jgi:hypothetical protein